MRSGLPRAGFRVPPLPLLVLSARMWLAQPCAMNPGSLEDLALQGHCLAGEGMLAGRPCPGTCSKCCFSFPGPPGRGSQLCTEAWAWRPGQVALPGHPELPARCSSRPCPCPCPTTDTPTVSSLPSACSLTWRSSSGPAQTSDALLSVPRGLSTLPCQGPVVPVPSDHSS